ncbi:MAG: hypothetical protein ABI402_13640 [Ferruginibacter sp.]
MNNYKKMYRTLLNGSHPCMHTAKDGVITLSGMVNSYAKKSERGSR